MYLKYVKIRASFSKRSAIVQREHQGIYLFTSSSFVSMLDNIRRTSSTWQEIPLAWQVPVRCLIPVADRCCGICSNSLALHGSLCSCEHQKNSDEATSKQRWFTSCCFATCTNSYQGSIGLAETHECDLRLQPWLRLLSVQARRHGCCNLRYDFHEGLRRGDDRVNMPISMFQFSFENSV